MSSKSAPRCVIILGATSTIAEALARRLAAKGDTLILAGRRADRLQTMVADLAARGGGQAVPWPLDLAGPVDASGQLALMADAAGGLVEAIVVTYGLLGDQRKAETDSGEFARILETNFSSAAAWCVAAASLLERQRKGVLLALGSVAGDRGRQSNYVYGAAKAGLSVLVEGIAHRLAQSGARAVIVKLGFVDTAMTAHIPKGGPLWAKPLAIAEGLDRLISKPSGPVVYMPWFWRPIMFVVRNVPSAIFHKTKL